jgi:hypothetical protein
MGAYRFGRQVGRRTVGFVVFAAMCCLGWSLPVSAQASTVPSIESESVSHLTPTDATLEASVNSQEGSAGDYYQFQLVRSPTGYAPEILCPTKLPPGTDGCIGTQSPSALPIGFIPGNTMQPGVDHPIGLDLASTGVTLQPGTTYHYRVLVARRVQTEDTIQWEPPTVYGADQTFTTPSGPPSIESESASRVTQTDATLEAQINPQADQAGDYAQFQLVKDPSEYASEILCPAKLPPGTNGCIGTYRESALPIRWVCGSCEQEATTRPVSLDLASTGVTLQPGTTYHYRVIAARAVQTEDTIQWEPPTVYGPDQTFTTPSGPPPAVESESLSHLTSTDATLEAQINTEGLETTYNFYLQEAPLCFKAIPPCERPQYEPLVLPGGKLLGSFVGQSVSVDLNSVGVSLSPGEHYEYWVTATSAAGTTTGHAQEFSAPEDATPQPLNTTTPSGTNGNSQGTSSTPTGPGGSPAPGVTPLGPQIVCLCDCARGCHTKKVSPKHLARTQKLSKALKTCAKKPKRKRAACQKQAHEKYATTASKAKKIALSQLAGEVSAGSSS